MNKNRLKTLAAFLERPLPKHSKFDLSNWGTKNYRDCGTTACAAGWATTIKSFNKAGLNKAGEYNYCPYFNGKGGESAMAEFLGITTEQSEKLFMPHFYKRGNRSDVARRIRALINNPKHLDNLVSF